MAKASPRPDESRITANYGKSARPNGVRPVVHNMLPQQNQPKVLEVQAMISAEEAERRRVSVRVALADSRIEGYPHPGPVEQEIFDAYVRGDIDPADLVDAIKHALGLRDS